MSTPCPHEVEVATAAASGHWPGAASPELRAHVSECASCSEMANLLVAASDAGAASDVGARLPSAAEVWWRLAVRARLEREHAAARPVLWLQGLAGACGVGLVLTVAGRGWPATEQVLVSAQVWIERLVPSVPRTVQPATEPLMALVLAASGALALATLVAAAFVWLADD
jgi:hypothetical protein